MTFRGSDGTELELDYATGLKVDGQPYEFPNPTVDPMVVVSRVW